MWHVTVVEVLAHAFMASNDVHLIQFMGENDE